MAKVCRYMYCRSEKELTLHCIPEKELSSTVRHWECECNTNTIAETTEVTKTHTA